MFAFTSIRGKIDISINQGEGPPQFILHGQNFHKIGFLVPSNGQHPKFSQLYIYDTENEISNRINPFRYFPPLIPSYSYSYKISINNIISSCQF